MMDEYFKKIRHDQFRFRMWTGGDKGKMLYDIEQVMDCLTQQMIFNDGGNGFPSYDHEGLHGSAFMQCTGVRDDERKLVWEGDIVEVVMHEERAHKDTPFGVRDSFRFVVKLTSDGCFHGRDIYPDESWRSYAIGFGGSGVKSNKVIGNIYENKDLLNPPKKETSSVPDHA